MGNRRDRTDRIRSETLPSSPSHSSSSSNFEFSIPVSPRKSCPADELFYKGQLLPLHLPLASPWSAPSSYTLPPPPSAATPPAHPPPPIPSPPTSPSSPPASTPPAIPPALAPSPTTTSSPGRDRRRPPANTSPSPDSRTLSRRIRNRPGRVEDRSGSRKLEVIRKCLRKVKPFYENLSQQKQQRCTSKMTSSASSANTAPFCSKSSTTLSVRDRVDKKINVPFKGNNGNCIGKISPSFSENLNYLRRTRRSSVASCPSSMWSSPTHSGSGKLKLRNSKFTGRVGIGTTSCGSYYSDNSTMVELQSAIQGAIVHCKNSMR